MVTIVYTQLYLIFSPVFPVCQHHHSSFSWIIFLSDVNKEKMRKGRIQICILLFQFFNLLIHLMQIFFFFFQSNKMADPAYQCPSCGHDFEESELLPVRIRI